MGTLSKQHNFTGGTAAIAAQVNANFDDIIAFVNGDVVHKDGSIAMTGLLTLPAIDPSSDNQAARKKYVDARLKWMGGGPPLVGSNPPAAGGQVMVRAGRENATTSGSGIVGINFSAFPSGLIGVFVTNHEWDNPNGPKHAVAHVRTPTLGSFQVQWTFADTSGDVAGQEVDFSWMALGW